MPTESPLSTQLPDPYIVVYQVNDAWWWSSVDRRGIRGRMNGPYLTKESVLEVAQAAAESLNDWEVKVEGG